MNRFVGYLAVLVLTAAFALVDEPGARFALGGLILCFGMAAVLLDFASRAQAKRVPLTFVWTLRLSALVAASYMLFLAYPVVAFVLFDRFRTDPPVPLAQQGPDTESARLGMMTLGLRSGEVFHSVYYFWDPSGRGTTEAYLRFDYEDEASLRHAIPVSKLKPTADGSDCVPPTGEASRPSWFVPPGTEVGQTFAWRTAHGRICFDERDHRVFIRMVR